MYLQTVMQIFHGFSSYLIFFVAIDFVPGLFPHRSLQRLGTLIEYKQFMSCGFIPYGSNRRAGRCRRLSPPPAGRARLAAGQPVSQYQSGLQAGARFGL